VAKSKSPEKRARIAEKNRLRNKAYKTRLKSSIKEFETAVNNNDVDAAREKLTQAFTIIDKNVAKGILHKKNAAHKKSILAKKFNAMSEMAE